MSSIIIPRKWNRQPTGGVSVKPIFRLKYALSPTRGLIDIVSRKPISIGTGCEIRAGIGGLGFYDATASAASYNTARGFSIAGLSGATETSVLIVQQRIANTDNTWLELGATGTADHFGYSQSIYTDAFANARWISGQNFNTGPLDPLKPHVVGISAKTGNHRLSISGKTWTTSTSQTFISPATLYFVGNFGGWMYDVIVFDRALSETELNWYTQSVPQFYGEIYQPQKTVLYFDVGGVGAQTLTPSLYVDGDTFHAATVSAGAVTLTPSLYSDGDTFHSAIVSQIGAPQTLTPDLYADGDTFHAATVGRGAVTLTPSMYADGDTFHNATVAAGSVNLAPSLVTDGDTFHSATVAAGSVTLTPSLVSDGDTFYTHAVVLEGGPQTLSPDLFADGDTFHAATVTPGSVTLTPSLYTDADTFHAAEIASGFNLQPPAYADADTFYPATVAAGAVSLAPDLFDDGDAFHAPTVSLAGTQTLTPDLFEDADTFYVPTLTGGTVILGAARSAGRQFQTGARSNIQTNRR